MEVFFKLFPNMNLGLPTRPTTLALQCHVGAHSSPPTCHLFPMLCPHMLLLFPIQWHVVFPPLFCHSIESGKSSSCHPFNDPLHPWFQNLQHSAPKHGLDSGTKILGLINFIPYLILYFKEKESLNLKKKQLEIDFITGVLKQTYFTSRNRGLWFICKIVIQEVRTRISYFNMKNIRFVGWNSTWGTRISNSYHENQFNKSLILIF